MTMNSTTIPTKQWLTIQEAVDYCPFGRTMVFELIKLGKLKSFFHKKPGNRHGCRMVYLPSIDSYLESQYALSQKAN